MNELIPIKVKSDDSQFISGRDLHMFLEIGTQYTKWFERMCEYGFSENDDFRTVSQKRLTAQGNESTFLDHELTIDMAKQLCMLARNEKGRQAREYFIQIERDWNSPEKVQYKQSGQWFLYQKYADKGYTSSKTTVLDADRSVMHTYWTQQGRLFIYSLLKSKGYLPLIEQMG